MTKKIFFIFLVPIILIGGFVFSAPKASAAATWSKTADQTNFGSNRIRVTRFEEFQNKLYAVVQHYLNPATETEIWSTSDGTTWTQSTAYPGSDGVGGDVLYNDMVTFNGYLYVSQSYAEPAITLSPNQNSLLALGTNTSYIYRTADGVTWSNSLIANGFGDVNNIRITRIIVFNNYLYAMTVNGNGMQVWRTANGTDWTKVGNNGLTSVNNWGTNSTIVFNDKLYIATANDTDKTQIIATSNGTDWTQANTNGFGSDYWGVFALAVFKDKIYAAAANNTTATFFASADGTTWAPITITGVDYTNISFDMIGLGMLVNDTITVNGQFWIGQPQLGAQAAEPIVSTDALAWTANSTAGMGDANNVFIHTMDLFKNYVYVGFDNTVTGGQIWRTAITPLSMSPLTLPAGTVGTAYSRTLTAASGTSPYAFSAIDALPPGLTLSAGGIISGTPTTPATYRFTVVLTDTGNPAQTASHNYSITINDVPDETPAVAVLPETGTPGTYLGLLLGSLLCFVGFIASRKVY